MIVKELPVQIVPVFKVNVGIVFTVTEDTAALFEIQPATLVPVTVKSVLVVGLTVLVPEE
jgi:hypothetical protein